MNLGTHIFFAGMVTAIFTGNPYFALLAGIGSFIPDLDREYIFVSRKTFQDEDLHRALFHNLLFLSGLFFVNVWLALGAFLHSFIDSFTTEKDRGVEWLFPFSRLVKRGRYLLAAKSINDSCRIELVDQKLCDRVYFTNEDSDEMTKLSNPDLKESKPVPWRRTYGPAANGQFFDKWLGLGSFSLFVLYSLIDSNFALASRNLLFSSQIIQPMTLLTGIVLFFVGGSLKRRGKSRIGYLTLFTLGGIFMALAIILSVGAIWNYVLPLNIMFVGLACIVLFVEAILVWRISTRGERSIIV